jgi:hypothetical protein
MSSANPIKGPRYQFIAGATHAATLTLMSDLHSRNNAEEAQERRAADAGPIIEGALAGVLNFALLSGQPGDVIREDVVAIIDSLIPRLVMARAENATGGGGNA